MKKLIRYFVAVSLCCLLAVSHISCGGDEPAPPEPSANRTILVYMVANNSLGGQTETEGFDYADRCEMITAAQRGDLNGCRWLVYYAPKYSTPELQELTADGFKTLKEYDNNTYSVSVDRMTTVFADMKKLAPAEEYGLILWSHANGWQQNGIAEKSSKIKPLAYGDDRGRMMNITSLRTALTGQNFEWIYADVCYFSSVEVAYELRNVTKYMVGCEARLPADGMPYDINMKYFTSKNVDLVAAASMTFAYYNDRPDPSERWCTMSVIKMDGMERLAEVTKEIYTTSQYPTNYSPQVMEDLGICYYYDLQHFVQAMNSPLYATWQSAIDNAVIYKAATETLLGGTQIRCHGGLSTYIMPDKLHASYKNYNTLSWYQDVAQYQPLP